MVFYFKNDSCEMLWIREDSFGVYENNYYILLESGNTEDSTNILLQKGYWQ